MDRKRDLQGMLGGAALVATGAAFAAMAYVEYEIGTPLRMGAGFLPLSVGAILAGCGAVLMALAYQAPEADRHLALRPLIAVLAAVTCFGLLIDRFGMVPAVIASVVITSLGDRNARPLTTALLAIFVPLGAVVIFRYGIGLPMPIVEW